MGKPAPAFRMDTRTGWRAAVLNHVSMESGALKLSTLPGSAVPLGSPSGSFGGLSLPITVAVGRGGEIYLLDRRGGSILIYDACSETFVPVACLPGAGGNAIAGRDPIALLVDSRADLLVLDAGNRRIEAWSSADWRLRGHTGTFARRGNKLVPIRPKPELDAATGVPTGALLFPADAWMPAGFALLPDGRVAVSDRQHGLIHLFGARLRYLCSFDGATDEQPALATPTVMTADRQGRLYVVEDGKAAVAVIDADGQIVERIETADVIADRFRKLALVVDEDGTIWISDRVSGEVCRVRRSCAGQCLPPERVRLVPADCPLLAFDASGNAIFGDPRSPCLMRADGTRYETAGLYTGQTLDSGLSGCVWDTVEIDAATPFGTRLAIFTTTSHFDLTPAEVDALTEDQWTATPVLGHTAGRFECAIRSRPGRFLWLRLAFEGDGAATPKVNAATVRWPRKTSAQYLPAVFSEGAEGADFFARFIEIFDHARAGALEPLEKLPGYFDPLATPAAGKGESGADFLDWLGGWIGLALDRNWSVERRRRLVAEAPVLFRQRGTIKGLKRHVALYTGMEPQVVEHFRLRRWLSLDEGRLGDTAALWGPEIVRRLQLDAYSEIGKFALIDGGDPLTDPFDAFAHRATLYVPAGDGFADADLAALEAIVEMANPAHVEIDVRLMRPRFVIGCDLVLGVNTVLGRDKKPARMDEVTLGEEILLDGPPRPFALNTGLRIGRDTILE
jgi:phage tail-like protein